MKKNIKKSDPKNEKIKKEIKEIRSDFKRLKKSKKRMQLLWYRTKKEHVALIKDLDYKLKALKKGSGARKTTQNRKSIAKPIIKKAVEKKR